MTNTKQRAARTVASGGHSTNAYGAVAHPPAAHPIRSIRRAIERATIAILTALTARLPLRIISEDGRPYLERYFVFHTPWLRCYVHRFVGSDPERGLHDHPWRWAASLVLTGWYIEHKRDGYHRRTFGNVLGGDTFHRVILPTGARECWTLFIHTTRDVKTWGFITNQWTGYCAGSADYSTLVKTTFHWNAYDYHGKAKDFRWELNAPRRDNVEVSGAAHRD